MNRQKGMLIVCEGISGSGKSESILEIVRLFRNQGLQTTQVEWNSNEAIRTLTQRLDKAGALPPSVYSLLQWISFFIDYFRVILPALRQHRVVIADRYMYTALTRDEVNGTSPWLGRVLKRFVRCPDWVIFYNTPPEICYRRILARGKVLFYPNKRRKSFANRPKRALQYLTEMQQAYMQLFSALEASKKTNVLNLHEAAADAYAPLAAYAMNKWEMMVNRVSRDTGYREEKG